MPPVCFFWQNEIIIRIFFLNLLISIIYSKLGVFRYFIWRSFYLHNSLVMNMPSISIGYIKNTFFFVDNQLIFNGMPFFLSRIMFLLFRILLRSLDGLLGSIANKFG